MYGLIVVGAVISGGFIGGAVGMLAAMLWADMEISSMDGPIYIARGSFVGAAAGAYIGGQIVAG